MEKINNKNGIEMFWQRANDIDKINILDSNGNYFNDMYFDIYEDDNGAEELDKAEHDWIEDFKNAIDYVIGE